MSLEQIQTEIRAAQPVPATYPDALSTLPGVAATLPGASVAQPAAEPSAAPISQAKLTANRINAQYSTGPRTPEGKVRASANSVKHGLFSRTLAKTAELLGEERADYDAMLADMRLRYLPDGAEENMVVEKIATAWWHMARLRRVGQARVAAYLEARATTTEALQEAWPFDNHELRLERSVSRLRKDLQFLQRLRNGENCKHIRTITESYERVMALQKREEEQIRGRMEAARIREEWAVAAFAEKQAQARAAVAPSTTSPTTSLELDAAIPPVAPPLAPTVTPTPTNASPGKRRTPARERTSLAQIEVPPEEPIDALPLPPFPVVIGLGCAAEAASGSGD